MKNIFCRILMQVLFFGWILTACFGCGTASAQSTQKPEKTAKPDSTKAANPTNSTDKSPIQGGTTGQKQLEQQLIDSISVTLWSPVKDSLERYSLWILKGNDFLGEVDDIGFKNKWENGHDMTIVIPLSGKGRIQFGEIENARLQVSKDPFSNPLATPLLQVFVTLESGVRKLVLPRTSKPDSLFLETSTWNWTLHSNLFPMKSEIKTTGIGDTSYNITIGASFDFLNKLSVDNIYSSVTIFAPNMMGRFGIDAGLFQYRNNSTQSGPNETDNYKKITGTDTGYVRQAYSVQTIQKIDNLGMYFNPTYKICDQLYVFANIEYRHRTTTETIQYKSLDSGSVGKDTTYADRPNPKYVIPSSQESTLDEVLMGPGITVSFKDQNVAFDMSFACTYNLRGVWSMFSQFEFTILASKLKLGGEVRSTNFVHTVDSQKEYVIYLAKELPITALADFFTGGK